MYSTANACNVIGRVFKKNALRWIDNILKTASQIWSFYSKALGEILTPGPCIWTKHWVKGTLAALSLGQMWPIKIVFEPQHSCTDQTESYGKFSWVSQVNKLKVLIVSYILVFVHNQHVTCICSLMWKTFPVSLVDADFNQFLW